MSLNLFVNNKNKPKQAKSVVTAARARQREINEKNRSKREKNNHKAVSKVYKTIHGGASPVVFQGTFITDNKNLSEGAKTLGYNILSGAGYGASNNSNGSGGSDGSGGGGSNGSGGSGSSGGSGNSKNYNKSGMSKSERNKLYRMKDSNVPYYYHHDENDLMTLAAKEERDFVWGLKEEIFLYTVHDRQKHKYITAFNIDSDANDIVTSCQVSMPYKEELMDYYIPGKTAFMIIGGVYDREVLFVGRVSEVNQMGDSIQIVGQNIGWKFKQYMPAKFEKKLQNLPVPLAVKAIFKQLGFTEGKYHMDLWAIPNVFKYRLDENLSVTYKGETVYNVPELTKVVDRMKDADINKYVASRANTRSIERNAKVYDESTEKHIASASVLSSTKAISSKYRTNYGIKTSLDKKGNVTYDTIDEIIYGTDKKLEYFTKDKSGDGEHTYDEVMNNIAAAIDAQYFIVDTTVCFVSFNALMAMSSSETVAKAIQPRIEFWQLMEDSYELDVNQYGYYNTVYVQYKNGTVKRSFEDLVRVYSEIPITYKDKSLNYEAAQLKAQAYLAAHIRDFGMQVRATILYSGKITVASFIKVQNPLTMSDNLFYVYGTSIQWDASNQTLICDLDLRYGPENPDNPEIPEYGLPYSNGQSSSQSVTGNVSATVSDATQDICAGAFTNDQRIEKIYDWIAKNVSYRMYYNSEHSVSETLQGKSSNCDDTTELLYQLCTAAGIRCEKVHGTLYSRTGTWGHFWCKVEYKGEMVIADVGRGVKAGLGKYNGKLVQSGVIKKNY